jgi:carbon-monoxide dehydrogenase medium subunit
MIPQSFEYSRPSTLAEALALIAQGGKALAGGQSLVPMMKLRLAAPEHLVDISRIPGLNTIEEKDGVLHIGTNVTHYQLESSDLVRQKCPLLSKAADQIGDVQVRNRGTIGGSIAHADPAADWPASLLALEARVAVESTRGRRTIAIEDFLVDTFTTALEDGELVVAIEVPVDRPGSLSRYQKLAQPASGFAMVGIAAHVVKKDGAVVRCRVGVTGLTNKAFRARGVEAAIESGKTPAEAVKGMAGDVDANSDIHASAEYRKYMTEVYTRRALESALS